MAVEVSNWEVLMLAGPVLGNMLIWFLILWIWNPDEEPQTLRNPQPRREGPERIPIRRNKSGTALSDFVRAMREEDAEPSRTASTLTPGIPNRIRIPSPKAIRTPLFPLSAPLSAETVMTPRNPHLSTFSSQMTASIDTALSRSPGALINLPFPPFKVEEKEDELKDKTTLRSALTPPSYNDLTEEANAIPLPQSPVFQANLQSHNQNVTHPAQNYQQVISHPGSSRRVRFAPHMRVVSTGTQLFPIDEQNPLSPGIDLPMSPVGPAIWDEEEDMGRAW